MTVMLYHLVCPSKYLRVVFDESVEQVLGDICLEIANRYDLVFLEIGTDREMFRRMPEVKKHLWGGAFWSEGYFMATVGQHSTETVIRRHRKGL